MSWNLHSQDQHYRGVLLWTYWTFRCSHCRAWLVVPTTGEHPSYMPKCSKGCR